jgi:hypothetical protein
MALDLVALVAAVIALVCGISDVGGDAVLISLIVLLATATVSMVLKVTAWREEARTRPVS